jgi:ATP-dependent DNA helicase RecQ
MKDRALAKLREVFGYDSFRPLQEGIIEAALAGRDVFALLPTGGGKSLCYQLPALLREGLTVVVSPLIALMKDQVDSLTANGVAATFLNSSLDASESRRRLRGLHNGEYKLLYVAPERLLLSGFLEDLQGWNVTLIAVDEAHCISEWGHDFRPEYRRLAELRDALPNVPVMALTATATGRVRGDIVERLRLREPETFVGSFNRANLFYRVRPKAGALDQVLEFLAERPGDSGIVYCLSRKSAETLAEKLTASGIPARAYHAGLGPDDRAAKQEAFLRDEVRVVCATIAFGMGINKPNVRFVLHYDLPKNLESYYQETGRAGRDGLPSECLLLFSRGDILKQKRMIEEKPGEEEQRVALRQLNVLAEFAESGDCRRRGLLAYFGETFAEENCGGCDNCTSPPEEIDVTVPAQKFLSCVVRVKKTSGFSFGLNHVVDVLLGSKAKGIVDRGHDALPTHGIGRELDADEWKQLANDLIRMGYASRSEDKFATVDITGEGLEALRERRAIRVRRAPTGKSAAKRERTKRRKIEGDFAYDDALFAELRKLRREIADAKDVPAYVIFSDVSLRHMARHYPDSDLAFEATPGAGRKKAVEFGRRFLGAIRDYVRANGRQMFRDS